MIKLFKKYFPSYFQNVNNDIYKVEYVVKTEFLKNRISYLNILISSLNLQFYSKTPKTLFYKYTKKLGDYNMIPFSTEDMLSSDYKIKFIEITPQLKTLLYSDDELNCKLGTQIIFNKLDMNYVE